MFKFRVLLTLVLTVFLFMVIIEKTLRYRIMTENGVERSLWTILANYLWRKSRISMTTTSTKFKLSNNSSLKPKFYTNARKLTTTSKLKDNNWKIDGESKCEMIDKTENYTRFAIGGFKIDKPEYLTFEYFDLYRNGIVEFGGKNWTNFPQLTIVGFQGDFKWPLYSKDLYGGEITCCAKDCSNAQSYVNNFCPRLKFRATWSCSIKWYLEYRSSQNAFGQDLGFQNGSLELTFVTNEKLSFAIFDYTRLETINRFVLYKIQSMVNYYLVSVVLRDNNQSYSYDVPFSNKSDHTLLKDTNCHANGIYILPFQKSC